ncbi:MAG: RimK family alpha-L-glutamate ligase [Pirellula sp.]|jgi:RimK family alpha-L-glutamate ligase
MENPFRIGVLGSYSGYYMRELKRAANAWNENSTQNADHRFVLVDTLSFESLSVWSGPELYAKACRVTEDKRASSYEETVRLNDYDVVLVRTMPLGSIEQIVFRMNALHVVEQSGTLVLNKPRCLEICIDKWLTLDKMRMAGILTPRTVCCQGRDNALEAWHELGEDCIVKPIFGGEGRGLVRVTDREMAWRVFSTLAQMQAVIYLQEFLPNDGFDLRLLVLDDELYTVRRYGQGNWRSNVSQGGKAERVDPTFEQADIAYKASRLVDGWMVGVDLIETLDGRNVLIEVNAVPGWKATGAACGVDLSERVIRNLTSAAVRR